MTTNFDDMALRFTREGAVKSGLGLEPTKPVTLDIYYTDLTASATSDTVDFAAAVPDGAILMGVARKLRQGFGDGGVNVTDCILDLGDGTNADLFIDAADIFTDQDLVYTRETADSIGDGTSALPLPLSAATTFRATITATGADVDTLTTGHVTLYLYIFNPEDPEA